MATMQSPASTSLQARRPANYIIESAKRNAHREESFEQGEYRFQSIWDHMISSQCDHDKSNLEDAQRCNICIFEHSLAAIPHLPELLFPENTLVIQWKNRPEVTIKFTALEALKMVDTSAFPSLQVAPAATWQEARRGLEEFREFQKPFDWTYTTEYAGTWTGLKEEETDEVIDLEALKRPDPILFYAQNVLYEDELHDHGIAQYAARIRVMPTCFFVLVRFYLRIDHVHVRVCDTRIFGRVNEISVLLEWSFREAKIESLRHLQNDVINDPNQIWSHLPVQKQRVVKLSPT